MLVFLIVFDCLLFTHNDPSINRKRNNTMDRNENIGILDQELTYAYQANTWMSDLHPYIKNLRLSELSLPGSHNAGMDKEIEYSDSYNYCQDYKILAQLSSGIRVLDLRFKYGGGSPGGYGNKLYTFYDVKSGRKLDEIIRDVIEFLSNNTGEIVILAIHKMEVGGSNPVMPWYEYYKFF